MCFSTIVVFLCFTVAHTAPHKHTALVALVVVPPLYLEALQRNTEEERQIHRETKKRSVLVASYRGTT